MRICNVGQRRKKPSPGRYRVRPLPAAIASDLSRKRERWVFPLSAPFRGLPHTTGSAGSR